VKEDCLACEFLSINLPTCIEWERHIDKERERMRDTNES